MPLVGFSMDVAALYPSITADMASNVIRDQTEKTTVTFENIDMNMALRYVSKDSSPESIKSWGLAKFCPKRTKGSGPRPGMVGAEINDPKWTPGVIPDSEEDQKKVIGRVLGIATKTIYGSSAYTFGGVTRVQRTGSPIGLDLSGEVGRLTMGEWDLDFTNLLDRNGIRYEMDKRYVDDINILMEAIPHGYRWVQEWKRLEYDMDWALEDEHIPLDTFTTDLMVTMANSIKKQLQFEGDCASNHEDGYLPVLDLKMKTVLKTVMVTESPLETSKMSHRSGNNNYISSSPSDTDSCLALSTG